MVSLLMPEPLCSDCSDEFLRRRGAPSGEVDDIAFGEAQVAQVLVKASDGDGRVVLLGHTLAYLLDLLKHLQGEIAADLNADIVRVLQQEVIDAVEARVLAIDEPRRTADLFVWNRLVDLA